MNAIQILLEDWQQKLLEPHSGKSFAVIHTLARTETPDVNGRWVLSITPCESVNAANGALRVASGTHTARAIKKPSQAILEAKNS